MTEAYVIGNLLGRLLFSYLLVWFICFLASRFNWRAAFRKTRRWWGILCVIIVFLLGVMSSAAKTGVL